MRHSGRNEQGPTFYFTLFIEEKSKDDLSAQGEGVSAPTCCMEVGFSMEEISLRDDREMTERIHNES